MNYGKGTETTNQALADLLENRGPVPECFAGVLIGITEYERDQIVRALRGEVRFTMSELPKKQPGSIIG